MRPAAVLKCPCSKHVTARARALNCFLARVTGAPPWAVRELGAGPRTRRQTGDARASDHQQARGAPSDRRADCRSFKFEARAPAAAHTKVGKDLLPHLPLRNLQHAMQRRDALCALSVGLLAFAIYLPARTGEFTFDDHSAVQHNPLVTAAW